MAETGAGQANVSKHLGLLHRHGFVDRRKHGLNVYYRISDPKVFELCELVCASIDAEMESGGGRCGGPEWAAHGATAAGRAWCGSEAGLP